MTTPNALPAPAITRVESAETCDGCGLTVTRWYLLLGARLCGRCLLEAARALAEMARERDYERYWRNEL